MQQTKPGNPIDKTLSSKLFRSSFMANNDDISLSTIDNIMRKSLRCKDGLPAILTMAGLETSARGLPRDARDKRARSFRRSINLEECRRQRGSHTQHLAIKLRDQDTIIKKMATEMEAIKCQMKRKGVAGVGNHCENAHSRRSSSQIDAALLHSRSREALKLETTSRQQRHLLIMGRGCYMVTAGHLDRYVDEGVMAALPKQTLPNSLAIEDISPQGRAEFSRYELTLLTNIEIPYRADFARQEDHERRQAITAAGLGCIAALSVERYLASNNLLVEFHQGRSADSLSQYFGDPARCPFEQGGSYSSIQFSWRTRTRICIGIARGLAILHEEVRPHIVHRDIKASNILLDKDLTPKISDFGLPKLIPANMTHVSTRVAGTM
ncbi:hypothetical protein TEA_019640 [Camellia sinensis var. sinensis]|uniref:non-specific serine/threonine protein kinase n=1 Tax=Camellia sinensis var. sinensis TaxID=542762 RepID=A0A4S4DM15_CAMSN|nr:hypothetical protein TEA_019640 [Camellia sinensis var. sinensis]